jgi:DNA-binding MarR family transcriptional regulator
VSPEVEAVRLRLLLLGRQLERMLARIAGTHGMSIGDWHALSVLHRAGPAFVLTPGAMADALGVTSGTMSPRPGRLIRAGLVEPVKSAADARSRPVRLTPEGHERWRSATALRTQLEQDLVERTLGPHRLVLLNALLRELMIAFESGFGEVPRSSGFDIGT